MVGYSGVQSGPDRASIPIRNQSMLLVSSYLSSSALVGADNLTTNINGILRTHHPTAVTAVSWRSVARRFLRGTLVSIPHFLRSNPEIWKINCLVHASFGFNARSPARGLLKDEVAGRVVSLMSDVWSDGDAKSKIIAGSDYKGHIGRNRHTMGSSEEL